MNSQFWWYLARSAGIVAWIMLTASVLWGLAMSTRSVPGRRPAWLLDLHRWLGGLTVGFVVLHIAALIADSYVQFSLADVLVPFNSAYKTTAVAWGVIAGWLLVVVELTSLARQRLSRRTWHAIHLSSYVTFALGTLHGFTAGTDAGLTLVRATGAAAVALVVVATVWRIVDLTERSSKDRTPSARPTSPRSRASASPMPTSPPLRPAEAPAPAGHDRAPAPAGHRPGR